ncbi:MAG: hypothetical protein IJS67_00420 [Clostridia bacterium]|nr:hypothetical protein [Clostridia bacterium]
MKKFLCGLLSVVISLGTTFALTACGGDDEDLSGGTGVTEKVDATRTQLYVGNYNGGYGDKWLVAAKKRFEEFYKDSSFESGKTGVQVLIDNKKEEFKSYDNLANTIEKSKNAIYFTEGIPYRQLLDSKYLLDISEILSTPLTEYGESKSIYDKMQQNQKDYYIRGDKCYAVPTYSAYFGLIYDVDLFEKKKFYYAAEKDNGNDGFVYSKNDVKSNGPDGVAGTYDDGLPATYDEFFALCDRMQDAGVTPFIWSGEYESSYIRQLAGALWADYEGLEESLKFYSCSGEINKVTEITSSGTVKTQKVSVTPSNGYELFGQAGRYYSVKFIEKMVKGGKTTPYYQKDCFNNMQSHTNAQEDYLYSKYEADSQAVAMLADGVWWQGEASLAFSDVAEAYGEDASINKRRLGFMPMPKATEEKVGEGVTLLDTLNAKMFVNANVADNAVQKDLAFKFVRFLNTDISLSEFHGITNVPKALDYEMTAEDKAKLTYFGNTVYEMKQNADIVYEYPIGNVAEEIGVLTCLNAYTTTINHLPYSAVGKTFKDHSDFTAEEYFQGLEITYRSKWSNVYGG